MMDETTEGRTGRGGRRIGAIAVAAAFGVGGLVLGGAMSTAWGSSSQTNGTVAAAGSDTTVASDTTTSVEAPDTTAAPESTTTTAPGQGQDDQGQGSEARPTPEEMAPYFQCLEDQGIDVPDPGTRHHRGPDGGTPPSAEDRAKREAAEQACQDKLPESVRQEMAQREAQRQQFEQCLADNGVTLPQPGTDPSSIDRQAMRKAMDACGQFAPEGGRGRGHGHGGPMGAGGPGCDHDGDGQGTPPADQGQSEQGSQDQGSQDTTPSTATPSAYHVRAA